MTFQLRQAERKQSKIRLGLSGAAGFGKTYSAILLAKGLTGDLSKVAIIDTENQSADLYSDLGNYNVITLAPPFSPDRYIEAIKVCEDAKMEVIIIDSITHEWDGEGGMLEIVDQKTKASTHKNSYIVWGQATPIHKRFLNAILQSKCHIITTVRRKQEFETTRNDRGKMEVQKLGTKEITREGFEYELTANLEFINDNHYVKASKDRTGLFMDKDEFIISEETGEKIKKWCESGSDGYVSGEKIKKWCESGIDPNKKLKIGHAKFLKYEKWILGELKKGRSIGISIKSIKAKYELSADQEKSFLKLAESNIPEVKNEATIEDAKEVFGDGNTKITEDEKEIVSNVIDEHAKKKIEKKTIARIKILQEEKGLDDTEYRAMLARYNTESCKYLSKEDAKKLIGELLKIKKITK